MGRTHAGPLRELSDDEFRRRYDCDRFTATVLANKFRYVASHMSNQFRWHAFSPIIRDASDMCSMVSGPPSQGFPMAAVSETMPLFYGSIPDAVRIVLDEFGPELLSPDDTLIVNDYYRVGTHFNDACTIRPVFSRGTLVGAVSIRAHLVDIGGSVFGGFSTTSRSTYQNGLRIPPTLLYHRGKPVRSTFKLLYDNTRIAEYMIPDLQTEYHALETAERLLQETIDRYGYDAYSGAVRYACDVSDEAMRTALESIPDGVYQGMETISTDGLPESPEYPVKVRITKVGDRAEFDLRGSAPASRSAINCTWLDAKAAVAMALKLLVDRRNPMTSGTLRSVELILPPGVICNPYPPKACQFYYDVVMAIVHAVYRALNPVLGPDAVASGMGSMAIAVDSSSAAGEEYPEAAGALVGSSGPWGATSNGDGDSGQQPLFTNLSVTGGVESAELMFREGVLLRGEYVVDTGGPGTFRGGASNVNELIARTGFWLLPLSDQPPAGGGVYGGKPGSLNGARRIESDSPERESVLFHPVLDGPVIQIHTGGGGGWGDPLARDPERVKVDVRDGYVSIEGAARDYGVVVVGDPGRAPEALRVDEPATAALRATLAAGESATELTPPGPGDLPGWGTDGADPGQEAPPPLEPVEGECPECGAGALRRAYVLGADGWFDAVTCGACLHPLSRVPWNRLGWVSLPEDTL